MKKYIVLIVILMFLFVGCSKNTQQICLVQNCNRVCENDYDSYCVEHTCKYEGCFERKMIEDEFCYKHKDYSKDKNENTNQLTPTIDDAKSVVDEYCDNLISKQSYIKRIDIDDTKTEVTNVYVKFHCNVVREDSVDNPATIYVKLNDGEFEVEELLYD